MRCYKHAKEETNLSCGKCERPICVRCMINGPAGIRCRDCASMRSTALYKIHPGRMVLATAVALVLGLVGAIIYSIGYFVLFVSPLYGGFVGDMVMRASGHKRGRALEVIAIAGIVLGGIIAVAPRLLLLLHPLARETVATGGAPLTMFGFGIVWPSIGVALAVSACYGRMRYM